MKHCVKLVYEYGIMTVGAVIYAMGIALFLDPNHLAPGGLTGIAIILNQFLPLETGTIIFIFNVPLIILGYLKLGRTLIFRTFYCVVVTTTLIDRISEAYGGAITNDLIISAIAGCGSDQNSPIFDVEPIDKVASREREAFFFSVHFWVLIINSSLCLVKQQAVVFSKSPPSGMTT